MTKLPILARILLHLFRRKRAEVDELRRIANALEYIVYQHHGIWLTAPVLAPKSAIREDDFNVSYDTTEERDAVASVLQASVLQASGLLSSLPRTDEDERGAGNG